MRFKYRGIDEQGRSVKGELIAQSREEALQILKDRHFFIEKIKPARSLFTPVLPPEIIMAMGRNLSLYLKSGISLPKALQLTAEGFKPHSRARAFLDEVRQEIEKGSSFSDALAQQRLYRVPPFFIKTVQVAQQTGNLDLILKELADYVQEQERIKRDVIKAFIYPTFILLIAVAMINFMLTHIIPKIVGMFEQTKSTLPTSTKITLALSHFFQQYGTLVMVLSILFIALFAWLWKKSETLGKRLDRWILRVPLIGSMLLDMELGRFARVMALLLQSGVPFAPSLRYAGETIDNRYLRSLFEQIATGVVEGQSFTASLAKISDRKIIPKDFLNAIALGEKSSHLADSLKNLAELYAMNNRDKIEVMLALLEPVLMLLIGGIIGFLVVSMLLPIFSISLGQ